MSAAPVSSQQRSSSVRMARPPPPAPLKSSRPPPPVPRRHDSSPNMQAAARTPTTTPTSVASTSGKIRASDMSTVTITPPTACRTPTTGGGARTPERPPGVRRPPPPRPLANQALDKCRGVPQKLAHTSGSVRSRPPPRPAGPPPRRAATVKHRGKPSTSTDSELASLTDSAAAEVPTQHSPAPLILSTEPERKEPPSREAPVADQVTKRTPGNPVYVAVCDFSGENDNELSFAKGEAIMLMEDDASDNGWILGLNESGAEGYLPVTFLED
ncbi:nascent polypeptide-associated complex subunit alpha, muscle-specific form-like [Sycon ciliatum]|uniref:nascent polypeptide-associated complex subunit alpha, muscle-specific form-like n=1 Tax=Sycon ciliatum TaxID=27933 RepID=UPI0020A95759|eukprot:scpid65534/ scgid18166/ 